MSFSSIKKKNTESYLPKVANNENCVCVCVCYGWIRVIYFRMYG